MSIQNTIRIIQRVENLIADLIVKYSSREDASHDLNKLKISLKELVIYLEKLDELKPNNTTNEIETLMGPINLDLDILKAELEEIDYNKLRRGIKVVKTALRFHPSKYSFFEFIVLWVYEFIYFI